MYAASASSSVNASGRRSSRRAPTRRAGRRSTLGSSTGKSLPNDGATLACNQAPPGIRALQALLAETRFDPRLITHRVRRLHRRDDSERSEASDVCGVEDLRVLDPKAIGGRDAGVRVGVEHVVVGAIADGVHRRPASRLCARARAMSSMLAPGVSTQGRGWWDRRRRA